MSLHKNCQCKKTSIAFNTNTVNVDNLVNSIVDYREQPSPGTASQSGTLVSGVGTNFSTSPANSPFTLVGGKIVFANSVVANIVSVGSSTSLTVDVSQTVADQTYTIFSPPSVPFAWSISKSKGEQHIKTAGVLDYTDLTKLPANENSIIRLASQTKFLGAFSFLQLVEKGLVSPFEQMSRFVPGFNPQVMVTYTPTGSKLLLSNPISTTNGSNVIVVSEVGHGRNNGDWIGIESATRVNDVPASLVNIVTSVVPFASVTSNVATLTLLSNPTGIFAVGQTVKVSGFRGADTFFNGTFVLTAVTTNTVSYALVNPDATATTVGAVTTLGYLNDVHQITVIDADSYSFTVATNALATGTGGGSAIVVKSLVSGVKRTSWQGTVYYYTTVPSVRPVLLYHALTYTLGYTFGVASLGLTFGFLKDPVLRNTQAGLYTDNLIPIGVPSPMPVSWSNIQEYAIELGKIPMVTQPGVDWVYGPAMSLLGTVIEQVDPLKRNLQTYMKNEIFTPLGMVDTGFYIANADVPSKLPRIQTMYFDGTKLPVAAIPNLAFVNDYFYGLNRPKTLFLLEGGVYSTPKEFSIFCDMIINKGKTPSRRRLITEQMITYLSENHTLENTIYNILDLTPTIATPAKWAKWGGGVGVYTGTLANIPLGGVTQRAIGWSGAFGTRYMIDIANKKTVNVGVNALGSASTNFWRERVVTANFGTFECLKHNNENVEGENPFVSELPQ
jgi:CubicO group peptidase (beta-lactamase class C family)